MPARQPGSALTIIGGIMIGGAVILGVAAPATHFGCHPRMNYDFGNNCLGQDVVAVGLGVGAGLLVVPGVIMLSVGQVRQHAKR